ncbi:hypothetical protein ACFZAV_39015 [Streptomyces sp. NPDC008343]|uniref:hypothetical protein n=1 Tax=Streptomyces sp. NPDC008343 TaxID=3364828 RepID=UPI0036E8E0B8
MPGPVGKLADVATGVPGVARLTAVPGSRSVRWRTMAIHPADTSRSTLRSPSTDPIHWKS